MINLNKYKQQWCHNWHIILETLLWIQEVIGAAWSSSNGPSQCKKKKKKKKNEKQKEKTEKCYAKEKNKIINKQKVVGKSVTGKTDPSSSTIQQQQQKKTSLNKQNPSSHHIYKYLIWWLINISFINNYLRWLTQLWNLF